MTYHPNSTLHDPISTGSQFHPIFQQCLFYDTVYSWGDFPIADRLLNSGHGLREGVNLGGMKFYRLPNKVYRQGYTISSLST